MRKIFTFLLLFLPFISQSQESSEKEEYELVGLGKKVNTRFHESAPIISSDGKTLYFFVANHPQNYLGKSGSQDIWYSERDSTGEWGEAIHMSSPLNKHRFNQVFNVLNDGNTLLIRGGNAKDSEGFSVTHRTKNGWSKPEELKVKDYAKMKKGIYSGGCMSLDGKVLILYFSEKEKGRYSDLYVSFLQPDGDYSRPKLIAQLNTHMDEFGPFLAPDGKTLYFASNRSGGLGGMDIWVTKRLDNTFQKWSAPQNMGEPVNTTGFDSYYSVDASGKDAFTTRAYMSADGGSLDILGLRPKQKPKAPEPMLLLAGTVYNRKSGEPMEAIIDYYADGEVKGQVRSSLNGEYKIEVFSPGKWILAASADGFLYLEESVSIHPKTAKKEIRKDLYLTPMEIGTTVRLNNIFFDFDKTTLRDESFPELDKVVELLNKNEGLEIEIGGHTDDYGSDDYNLKLSQGRSEEVRKYIIQKGISTYRVYAQGYGESKPEVGNDTEEGRQINRRVEFKILKN